MLTWVRKTGTALLLGCFAAPAAATSLADALVLAYQTNPQLLAQQAALRSADEDVISARAALLPALTQTFTADRTTDYTVPRFSPNPFSSNRNPTTVLTLNTQLTLQLFDGGADQLTVESAQYAVRAARQALLQTEQSILFSTVQAYMNVRRDQQFVRLAQNNVRVLAEQVRAAKDRFDVGEVTRTDVAQAEARFSAAKSQLEANRGSLQRSVNSYIAVVGSPPRNLRNPPPAPKLPGSAAKAEAVAIRQHPRVLQAQLNAKSAEARAKSTTKNRHPNINAQLNHSLGGRAGGENYTTESLSLRLSGTWTIYQGGALDAARRKQVALWQQALANVQQAGYVTRQAVRDAYANWEVANASIQSNRDQVRAAEVAFEGVKEEAKLGARTTLDALDAEQELLVARSQLISAIRDQYVGQYQVLAEMGLLTAKHLNLGIPLYDPGDYSGAVSRQQISPLGDKRWKLLRKIKKRKGD